MDATLRHSIRVQVLTDEAFAPYGDIIKPRLSGEQFDRAHSYRPIERTDSCQARDDQRCSPPCASWISDFVG